MATRKTKRFAGGKSVYEDDSYDSPSENNVQDDASGVDAAVAAQAMRSAAEAEGAKDEKAYSGPIDQEPLRRPISKTPSTPSVPVKKSTPRTVSQMPSRPVSQTPSLASSTAGAGRGAINRYAEEKDFYGRTKSEKEANLAKVTGSVKSGLSSIGDYLNSLGSKEKKHGTYRGMDGKVVSYKKGGSVSSASSRGDGIAQRGKTRGKMC